MQKHVKSLQHFKNVTENAKNIDVSNHSFQNSIIIEMNESEINDTVKNEKKKVSKNKIKQINFNSEKYSFKNYITKLSIPF
jgi:light-regulated signal transduction histidine kinase (bacteriophytochrome)